MRALALSVIATVLAIAPRAEAQEQQRGAVIHGIVTDSMKIPVASADIFLRPGGRRARTDSSGRYTIGGLDDGGYVITARKIGFKSEQWDAKLSKNGRVEVNFTLQRYQQLDTVKVTASGRCEGFSLGGFECRKKVGGGLFLDYPDIDEKNQAMTADLFRTIPGFRVQLRSTREGVFPVVLPSGGASCITHYVDGRIASAANPIPRRSVDLVALEVYRKADSIPVADLRYVWQAREVTSRGRCYVVMYWTVWAPI